MKKTVSLLIAVLLVVSLFAGCGAKATMENAAPEADRWYDGVYDMADGVLEAPSESVGSTTQDKSTANAGVTAQKLIRTLNITAETNDMDAILAHLDAKVKAMGGYMESKSVRNGSRSATYRYRYADLTIRVPVTVLDEFVEHIAGETNVTDYNENADDITLSYVATASRVKALEVEQERLLELLAKAENMSDLLLIEERLTQVRTELEKVTSQLRLYDNLVDYGTIHLSLTQVEEFTVVEEKTVWQRIGIGLKENWNSLCDGATELFVFLVTSLPYLIPLAVAGAVALIAVRLAMRKTRTKKTQPPQETAE